MYTTPTQFQSMYGSQNKKKEKQQQQIMAKTKRTHKKYR